MSFIDNLNHVTKWCKMPDIRTVNCCYSYKPVTDVNEILLGLSHKVYYSSITKFKTSESSVLIAGKAAVTSVTGLKDRPIK